MNDGDHNVFPLNLFTNFQEAAANFSETPIIFDEPLSAFPELGLETTYKNAAKVC